MPTPASHYIDDYVRFALALADVARCVTVPAFRADLTVDNKATAAGFDPVTRADRDAERAMRDLIESTFPDHGVEGEEHPDRRAASGFTWTLDPIDGTRSFIAGAPLWTTLIALSFEGEPLVGIIDQPVLDERWVGRPGGAVFIHDGETRALTVRRCPRLTQASMACTDPFEMFNAAEAAAFEQVRRTARMARYGGDAYAYGLLAMGTLDLVIEAGLAPHDVRALVPIVEGAGGVLTNWRGDREAAWNGGQVVAAGDAAARDEALVALHRSAL